MSSRQPSGTGLSSKCDAREAPLADLENVGISSAERARRIFHALAVHAYRALLDLAHCFARARHQLRAFQHVCEANARGPDAQRDFFDILRQSAVLEARNELIACPDTSACAVVAL